LLDNEIKNQAGRRSGREGLAMDDQATMRYTSKESWAVAISAMFGFGLDFYNLIILVFLFGVIQSTLGISLPQAGIIISATLAASVVGGIGIGWLGDKIGRKNALMCTLVLLAAGALLSAVAWDFVSLLSFRVIAGIGVGGEWGAGIVLFNEVWNPKRRGMGSALVQAMAAAGTAFAAVVAASSLANFAPDTAWRVAMAVGALPLVLMLYIRRGMPESRLWAEYDRRRRAGELPPEHANRKSPLVEMLRGASLRYFVLGVLITGGYMIAYQSITSFMPALMVRKLGASPTVVRDVSLMWAAVLAIGMLFTGWISDRYGRRLAVVIATLIGAAGFIAIYYTGDVKYPGTELGWSLFWAYCLFGFGQGAAGQYGPWYSELYPVELRATATSTIYTTGRLVGALAPTIVPIISPDLLDGMMFGLVGVAIGVIVTLLLPETAGRSFAVVESKERESVAVVVRV
jgi:MFS family permease